MVHNATLSQVFTDVVITIIHRVKELDSSYNPGEQSHLYALWAGSVIGPFVHILVIVHACVAMGTTKLLAIYTCVLCVTKPKVGGMIVG